MRLTREQYYKIKDKLLRLCGIHQPLFYENGTFEIHNIPENELNNLKLKLKSADFVDKIDTYKGRDDFNHLSFNKGFPEPGSYWNIRGFVKTELKEDLEDVKSIISDQIRGEWEAIQNYNKAVSNLQAEGEDTAAIESILKDIAEEEQVHVGELQKCLSEIEPKLDSNVEEGKEEAEEKLSEPAETDLEETIIDESWQEYNIHDLDQDQIITTVITDRRFIPAADGKQRIVLKDNNVKIVAHCLNGVVVKGRVKDIITVCDICNVANPYELYTPIDESVETNLEEEVEIHKILNPKIWDDEQKLKPEIKSKILQIVEKFKEYLNKDNVELKVDDIYLLGSNANYNYNDDSDLDIHIIADESLDCSGKHLPLLYDAYKSLFNSKYEITIKGINVELYVENAAQMTNVSAGIYSMNKGWIRKPDQYEMPDIDQEAVSKGVDGWEKRYFKLTEDGTVDQIDAFINEIYQLRKESIQKDGEFGLGNLIFKEVRRLGYLSDLKKLKDELIGKELSLENLK